MTNEIRYPIKINGASCANDCPQLGPGYCRLFNEGLVRISPTVVTRAQHCLVAASNAKRA